MKTVAKHTVVALAVLLGLLILWQAQVAVIIFLCALALGACMYPVAEHLQTYGWHRSVAIGITIASSIAVSSILVVLLLLPLAIEGQALVNQLTIRIDEVTAAYPDHWLVRQWLGNQHAAPNADSPVVDSRLATIVQGAVGTATQLMELSAQIAICFALSIYWTIDRARLERLWLSLLPVHRRNGALRLMQSVERELGAYLRSELAQGILAVLLLWLGFTLLGLPYPATTASIATILFMIPWLGNLLAMGAVAILSSGKWQSLDAPWLTTQSLLAIVYLLLLVAVLEFLVEPWIFKRQRYNSLWTVLATIALTYSFGIGGLVFGPAVGYGLQILLRNLQPLLFHQPQPMSLDRIAQRMTDLRTQCAEQNSPPEVASFLERLETIVTAQQVATTA